MNASSDFFLLFILISQNLPFALHQNYLKIIMQNNKIKVFTKSNSLN